MKKHTQFYTYMEPYFATGDDTIIKNAKAAYRKKYKAEWRRKNRQVVKEVMICFADDEFKDAAQEAKRHSMSMSKFVKQSTLSYINKCYLVPNDKEVKKIIQLLTMTQIQIEELDT
ncbi:MAG: hypothetical protein IPI46_08075 [Bacteroidetes bacterium]|nr:hypothetical protein [Bacteroidota bacterium]